MARPHKQAPEKRAHVVSFRSTEADYAHLTARATAAGLSLSDYAYHAAKGMKPRVVQSRPTLPFAAIEELRRIGVNLNQLARIANATGEMPARLDPALEQLQEILGTVMGLMDDDTDDDDPSGLTGE